MAGLEIGVDHLRPGSIITEWKAKAVLEVTPIGAGLSFRQAK